MRPRAPRIAVLLLGAAVIGVLIRVALSLPILARDMQILDGSAAATAAEGPAAATAKGKEKPPVSSLSCFGCHNYKRFHDGSEKGNHFAHGDHESVGHCHKCHAFERHFKVTLREEACKECHDDGVHHGEASGEPAGE